ALLLREIERPLGVVESLLGRLGIAGQDLRQPQLRRRPLGIRRRRPAQRRRRLGVLPLLPEAGGQEQQRLRRAGVERRRPPPRLGDVTRLQRLPRRFDPRVDLAGYLFPLV